jgi:hypothetical protein
MMYLARRRAVVQVDGRVFLDFSGRTEIMELYEGEFMFRAGSFVPILL